MSAPPCGCRASPRTSRTSFVPRAPTPRRARCATPSPSWRSSCARATAPSSRGARRGEGERAQLNLARLQAGFLDGQPAPVDATVLFAHATLRDGFVAPQLKLAIVPEHRLLRRRQGRRPEGPRAGAIAAFTDLRAGLRSSTRTMASRSSRVLRPRPSEASPATTSSWSTGTATASSSQATSSTRSAATWAPTPASRRSPSSAASSGSSRSCAPAGPRRRSPAS